MATKGWSYAPIRRPRKASSTRFASGMRKGWAGRARRSGLSRAQVRRVRATVRSYGFSSARGRSARTYLRSGGMKGSTVGRKGLYNMKFSHHNSKGF